MPMVIMMTIKKCRSGNAVGNIIGLRNWTGLFDGIRSTNMLLRNWQNNQILERKDLAASNEASKGKLSP